jgi:SWI/SNF-related matrix-associated actin-dependent regulator 1 of chromatin subfamily A
MLTLRRLAMTCRRRLMLTGTPLQNDLEELQNLLSFLLPDVFQADVAAQLAGEQVRAGATLSADVARLLVFLCMKRRRFRAGRWTRVGSFCCSLVTAIWRHDQESMDALAERMKALLGPFVLRRLKSEVASQLVMKEQRVRVQCLMRCSLPEPCVSILQKPVQCPATC